MPTLAEALAIAVQHHRAGRIEAAEQIYREILAANPDQPDALHLLGVIASRAGRHADAALHLRRALELKPDHPITHYNLGVVLQAQGQTDEALTCFLRAVELKPDYAAAHNNAGNAYQTQGQSGNAVAAYRRALELMPDLHEIHCNLGNAFQSLGKLDEAIECFQRALELNPGLHEAHYNLGTTFQTQRKLDQALDSYRRALELNPDHAESHYNLATVRSEQGKLDEAVASYRKTLELKPDFAAAWNNLFVTLQYRPGVNLAQLAAAHAEYDRQLAAPLRNLWRPHENDRNPERRLRLGFVSPNFGWHAVGFFVIGALENLDPGQCETVCYSDRKINDPWAARFRAAASLWRDTSDLSDQQLAEQVRTDQIDILFDLAGHTAKNRLLAFARKPAPIQVTWADYVGTTGLAAMDYILADRYEIPPESEAHYCERVLRLPDGYVCYDPPPYAPVVSPLPAMKQGLVTFGCFNDRVKITPPAIAIWARILNRLPQSRLLLKYRGMNEASITGALASEFASHGIDPQRIECLGWSPHVELLAEYNRIDLALDTFPYNGGLTTCESLWMGVPVITCPGETFAGRHSLSHLSNVVLTETIARDLDEYVVLAVSLANDLPRLAELRAGLRQRVAASPLCDAKRFAENLMRILRDAWQKWCHEARG